MQLTEWIENFWNISPDIQWKIGLSILVVVVLWLIRHFINRILFSQLKNARERYFWKNVVRNIQYALVLIIISSIWVDRLGSLATFFGLVTAGLAIALQDPLVNVAGWLFVVIRRPFDVGDRIEIDGLAGDVIDIRFFQFTLNEINNWVDADQSTGRIIHVPNGRVFKVAQANYTQGFSHIWNEIGVTITFESDWEKAKELLEEIVKAHAEHLSRAAEKKLIEASKKYLIFYHTLTPIVYTSVEDIGVKLSMRYLVNPKRRRNSEHKIWEDILHAFKQHETIDFAYPTQRIYYNLQEGKTGTVKPPNFPTASGEASVPNPMPPPGE
ncbi:MAG: mechanosensitive ion channel family protein [Bacteroidota bacterium]